MLFGIVLILALITQIISGTTASFTIYSPIESIQYITDLSARVVSNLHNAGASIILFLLCLHFIQKTFKQSYLSFPIPWVTGIILTVLLLLTASFGHITKLDQRGYWGFIIVRNIVAQLPFIHFNQPILSPDEVSRKLILVIHIIIPIILGIITVPHVYMIFTGPRKTRIKLAVSRYYKNYDGKLKQWGQIILITLIYAAFFVPAPHPANPDFTPEDLSPAWYMRPFFAMLLYIDDPLSATLILVTMITAPVLLPFYKRIILPCRSKLFVPLTTLWFVSFTFPSVLSVSSVSYETAKIITFICLAYYFAYFILLYPLSAKKPRKNTGITEM